MNHKKTCCVCFTSEKVHKFPQGKGPDTAERFAVWANFAAIENVLDDQKCYALCEKHFERRMFINNLSARLVKPAYPTLHPPVYHGPITMDGTVVGPSIPKSETFEIIYLWKEALLLSNLPLPESVMRRLPSIFSDSIKKSQKTTQDTKPALLPRQSLAINESTPPRGLVSDTITNSSVVHINKRSPSPVSDSSKIECIKTPLVLKTYSRKSLLNKKDGSSAKGLSGQVNELSPSVITSPNEKHLETGTTTAAFSSIIDDDADMLSNPYAIGTSSPLFCGPGSPLSPVTDSSTYSYLSLMEAADSFNSISTDSTPFGISTENEPLFTNIVSMLTDNQEKDIDLLSATDLLSAAINNADISFDEETHFCSGPKKQKKYDSILFNSVLDDMSLVENLFIYYC